MKKIKKPPLVSMIIAAYNEEDHIESCLMSLINQDYKNLEIVVTDDGSDDKTVQIIKNLAKKSKRVKLVQQDHLGMAHGWNNSFRNSKGEIVIMYGADMVAGKEFVAKMIRPIIEEGALGTYPEKEVIKNISNIWARAKGKMRFYRNNTTYLAIRRDMWIKAGGADEKRGYDADQSFYDALNVPPVAVNAETYHHYPGSLRESWTQSLWIGNSMSKKNRILFFIGLPVIPLLIIYRSIQTFRDDPYLPFIFFLPFYNILKYVAFFVGNLQYLALNKRKR